MHSKLVVANVKLSLKLFVCLFAWGSAALSAQIGYIVPQQ